MTTVVITKDHQTTLDHQVLATNKHEPQTPWNQSGKTHLNDIGAAAIAVNGTALQIALVNKPTNGNLIINSSECV
jgi:hypothetical protein